MKRQATPIAARRHAASFLRAVRLRHRRPGARVADGRRGARGQSGTGARRRTGGGAAIHTQGQARHLPLHGRRALADRPLRSQADADEARRTGDPRRVRQGRTLRVHQGQAQAARVPVPIQESYGQSGAEISELLPNLAKVADDITIVRSMRTTQFNHAPAQIFMNTGHQVIGRPSLGSWLSYGLGSENSDLPGFVVLLSGENNPDGGKSCWGSGFLPTVHQGVEFRSSGEPVLFVSNPDGVDADVRHRIDRGDQRSEPRQQSQRRRPGDPDADRRLRARLSDADERAGADRPLEGAGVDARTLRHRARQAPPSPTTACSRAGWSSAASASSSCITAAGTRTATHSARTSSKNCRTSADRPTGRSTGC